jgi:hypothetical protein
VAMAIVPCAPLTGRCAGFWRVMGKGERTLVWALYRQRSRSTVGARGKLSRRGSVDETCDHLLSIN